jgi:DNA polymerase-3 subunit epsilon
MNELCTYGNLTRSSSVRPEHEWAVIDLETTGLEPHEGRVIEVSVLRLSPDGTVIDEFATLIDPGVRHTGKRGIHGIELEDIQGAPTPEEVWPAVASRLRGAVIVSHKLDFEEKWIVSEMQRAGVEPLVDAVGLDTLLVARSQFQAYPYRLSFVHAMLTNRPAAGGHAALADARAVATILRELLASGRLGWSGPRVEPSTYEPLSIPVKARVSGVDGVPLRLPRIVAGLPVDRTLPPVDPVLAAEYLQGIRTALADYKVSNAEFTELSRLASSAGFTQETIRAAHDQLLAEVRAEIEADGVITRTEAADVWVLARELEQADQVDHLVPEAPVSRALKGERIVVSDDSDAGDDLAEWVSLHGAKIGVNITKTVTLVIDDAPTERVLAKAQEHSATIITVEQARVQLQQIIDAHVAESAPDEVDIPRSSFETVPWRKKELPQELVTGFFDAEMAYASEKRLRGLRREWDDLYGDDDFDDDDDGWIVVEDDDDFDELDDFDEDYEVFVTTDQPLPVMESDAAHERGAKIRRQGLWAMWLSILGFCFVTAVIGVILGFLAMNDAKNAGLPRPGTALAAVIIGSGWLALFLLGQLT